MHPTRTDRSRLPRTIPVALLVAVVAVALTTAVSLTSPFKTLDGRSLDWRFLFRAPLAEVTSEIVVVLVEEEANLPYRSPIPRRHLAAVVRGIAQADLVGLDILLDQPSFDADGDEQLKEAFEEYGRAIAVSYLDRGEEHLPHPYFEEALLDHGYATFATGTDEEILRWGTMTRYLDAGNVISLAGALYAHRLGVDTAAARSGAASGLEAGGILINYAGPPNAVHRRGDLAGGFTVCPSHLIAAGVYPPAFFAGKIVLLGSGLTDAPDRFRTPYFAEAFGYEKMFGVEVHAHFLRTLLERDFLTSWDGVEKLLLLVLLAVAGALAVMLTDTLKGTTGVFVLISLLWIGGFVLFASQGMVLPLIEGTLAPFLSYGMATAYRAMTEGRDKRQIRQLFEKYLAPGVVQQLLQNPKQWELGGKSMDITVMFADLEGFTPLSERLSPEQLVATINEYLTEMTNLILEEGGTIDKYEGDLIMAFFGAPLAQVDHASRACRVAIRMQERMVELRGEWGQEDRPELKVRIGVHSGEAVVGNMGSNLRFDYTAMGDTVNLASRLEGANKDFGTYTLVSQQTRDMTGGIGFDFRSLGEVRVKGKSEPVAVYELLRKGKGSQES